MGEVLEGAGEGGDLEGAEESGEGGGRECARDERGLEPRMLEERATAGARTEIETSAHRTDDAGECARQVFAGEIGVPQRKSQQRANAQRLGQREGASLGCEAGDAARCPGIARVATTAHAERNRHEQPSGGMTQISRQRFARDLAVDVEGRFAVQLQHPVALDARHSEWIGDRATALAHGHVSRSIEGEDQPAGAAAHGALGNGELRATSRAERRASAHDRRGLQVAKGASQPRRVDSEGIREDHHQVGLDRGAAEQGLDLWADRLLDSPRSCDPERRGFDAAQREYRHGRAVLVLAGARRDGVADNDCDDSGAERLASGSAGPLDVEVAADGEEQRCIRAPGPCRRERIRGRQRCREARVGIGLDGRAGARHGAQSIGAPPRRGASLPSRGGLG